MPFDGDSTGYSDDVSLEGSVVPGVVAAYIIFTKQGSLRSRTIN